MSNNLREYNNVVKWSREYNGGTYTLSLWRYPAILANGEKVNLAWGVPTNECADIEKSLFLAYGEDSYVDSELELTSVQKPTPKPKKGS